MDNFEYSVVILKNRKIFKVIKNYKSKYFAVKKYELLKDEKQVLYERQVVNCNKILESNIELALLVKNDSKQSERIIYSESGARIVEKSLGEWKIFLKCNYGDEETFFIYGLKKRLNVLGIFTDIFKPRLESICQILIVLNKIVIKNQDDIEVILCKNVKECHRLYNFLFTKIIEQKFNNFIFLGEANKSTRSSLYDSMEKHMGLKRNELYRTSTRS